MSAHLLDCLARVPFDGIGHRGNEPIEVFARAPADIVMLVVGKGQRAILWPSPIDHAYVFVRVGDVMNVEKPRRNQGARAGGSGGRPFADEIDLEAALFFCFAQRRLLGILIQLDVAAERKPFIELAMMNQQDLPILNYENGDREIDLFMDVGHGAREA